MDTPQVTNSSYSGIYLEGSRETIGKPLSDQHHKKIKLKLFIQLQKKNKKNIKDKFIVIM